MGLPGLSFGFGGDSTGPMDGRSAQNINFGGDPVFWTGILGLDGANTHKQSAGGGFSLLGGGDSSTMLLLVVGVLAVVLLMKR